MNRRDDWKLTLAEGERLVEVPRGPRSPRGAFTAEARAARAAAGQAGKGVEEEPQGPKRVALPDGWEAVKVRELSGTYRFFARLRQFDLCCPRCGDLYLVRARKGRVKVYSSSHSSGPGGWDPVLSRFQCRQCGLSLQLSILAASVAHGKPSPAPDQVPTLEEALRMRAARLGGDWTPSQVARRGVKVNKLERGPKRGED